MEFKDKLKNLRQDRNMTQQDLAKTIYVSRSAIAKWENGLGVPSNVNLKLLCDFFNVEESWLLNRDDLKEEIKMVKAQKRNIAVSIIGIIFPIIFTLLLFVPIFHFNYEPGYIYPAIYLKPISIMDFSGAAWGIVAIIILGMTFIFSIADIGFLQFRKKSVRYFRINFATVILSAIIFITVFVCSISAAVELGYIL